MKCGRATGYQKAPGNGNILCSMVGSATSAEVNFYILAEPEGHNLLIEGEQMQYTDIFKARFSAIK